MPGGYIAGASMIVINLMGGLGNQMFQYAAARHLAIIHDTELRIDGTRFAKLTANKEHTLQLENFNIGARQANPDEIQQLCGSATTLGRMKNFLRKVSGKVSGAAAGYVYHEPEGSQFKAEFFGLDKEKYLIGYFNSYKYFDPAKNVLIREFTPKTSISEQGQSITRLIEATNSVSIHIRRGDYVANPEVYKCIEGIITERYYRNAIEYVATRIESPHFFVFSNDMCWVKENFKIPHEVTFVDFNSPQRGFEDLWLMSRCKHNILAGGSTFSWWAAYLNPNSEKIVVRTENVSNDPLYNCPEDYFPHDWVTVAS